MEKDILSIRDTVKDMLRLMEELVVLQSGSRECCRAVTLPLPPIESQEHVINTTSTGKHGITDEDVESEEWMSRKEAWTYLGVVKSTLEAMINSGELPSYRKKGDQNKKRARVWLRRTDVEELYRQYTLRKGKEKTYVS